MPEWKKAGNLVASTVANLKEHIDKDMPHVLIDARDLDAAKKEHIKGAASIPLSEIVPAKDRLPGDKKAPIIIYSDSAKTSEDAFKTVRKWGYPNVAYLTGGIEAWKNAGNPVMSGELKQNIVYASKPRPGEVGVEDFKNIAETFPKDKFILDVRDEDEAADGMFKGAKNIPTQEIKAKLADIPKDKEIIAHCSTGVRAEIAYHALKEAGYKARFLNAKIKIDKDGKYEITKE
ncbi:MAG TPA: hypothetical protein DHV16_09805 [Nitrospiraceae bacterium]|nr:hypothetical protein [Nitrospiraceae bacterium]